MTINGYLKLENRNCLCGSKNVFLHRKRDIIYCLVCFRKFTIIGSGLEFGEEEKSDFTEIIELTLLKEDLKALKREKFNWKKLDDIY